MKHPSNREFFAYWDKKRGTERAPDRADIDPAAVRGLLGDIFVLSCEPSLGFPFRVAGTRVCALAGCDLKDASFAALFNEASRREIEEITTVVADESLGAIAGITATREDGSKAHLELLLLPFNARPHTPGKRDRRACAIRRRMRRAWPVHPHLLALSAPAGEALAARDPQAADRTRPDGL
ncbi:hypothetical protein ACVWW5_003496 [Bradyrhizobium sp. LM3.4]